MSWSTNPENGTESDVRIDKGTAYTRKTGGLLELGTYVGRISPDDTGDSGESGAEARAWEDRP